MEQNKSLENKYLLLIVLLILICICVIIGFNYYFYNEEKISDNATIEEKIEFTLKNRYGKEFVKESKTTYRDSDGIVFSVNATEINASKYIITDDYLNNLQVNKIANKMINILTADGISNVTINLAPASDCRFVGSCAPTKYFYDNYTDNTDDTKLSERSKTVDLKQYIGMSNIDFYNNYKFVLVIKIVGDYSSFEVKQKINHLFDELNDSGYKNNLGYEITVKSSDKITTIEEFSNNGSSDGKFVLE